MKELLVHVRRGEYVESTHRVHVVVAQARVSRAAASLPAVALPVRVVKQAGNRRGVNFVRSAIKMFQALPLIEDGGVERFGLTSEEVAITTASHGGEPFHVAAVRSILHRAGIPEDALACGAHPPMHQSSADTLVEAGLEAGRVHNNCSGKHAGMLALARLHGWPRSGYHELPHRVQQRVLQTLSAWTGVAPEDMRIAVDGCALPTFALPLDSVAAACARFAAAARGNSAPARVFRAMTEHPEYVAGTNRLCTDLMRVTCGRVFAKVGAEGYYCAGAPEEQLGIAIKVEDGAKRASEVALLHVLMTLNLVRGDEGAALARYASPAVLNTRGDVVGSVSIASGL